jgi:hypothetical protein
MWSEEHLRARRLRRRCDHPEWRPEKVDPKGSNMPIRARWPLRADEPDSPSTAKHSNLDTSFVERQDLFSDFPCHHRASFTPSARRPRNAEPEGRLPPHNWPSAPPCTRCTRSAVFVSELQIRDTSGIEAPSISRPTARVCLIDYGQVAETIFTASTCMWCSVASFVAVVPSVLAASAAFIVVPVIVTLWPT